MVSIIVHVLNIGRGLIDVAGRLLSPILQHRYQLCIRHKLVRIQIVFAALGARWPLASVSRDSFLPACVRPPLLSEWSREPPVDAPSQHDPTEFLLLGSHHLGKPEPLDVAHQDGEGVVAGSPEIVLFPRAAMTVYVHTL